MSDNFPHGTCECPENGFLHASNACKGPAAFKVESNGRQYKACTRCFHPDDKLIDVLVKPSDPPYPFFKWDAQGAGIVAVAFAILYEKRIARQKTETEIDTAFDNLLAFPPKETVH